MKKFSVSLCAALLLAGSTLALATATHLTPQHASVRTAFPSEFAANSHRDGKNAAIDWYNNYGSVPPRSVLQDEYDMALQNRLDAEDDSYEYWYWTGYQFQIKYYMQ